MIFARHIPKPVCKRLESHTKLKLFKVFLIFFLSRVEEREMCIDWKFVLCIGTILMSIRISKVIKTIN